jgi:general secretion pathway protein M
MIKRLREQLEAWLQVRLAPLRARYDALQPREQLIVAAGLLVGAVMLIYLVLWEPFALARDHQAKALVTARAYASRLELAAAKAAATHTTGALLTAAAAAAAGGDTSLLSIVDTATKDGTIAKPPSRIQPDGDKQVRVWFDDVSFDALTRWMFQAQQRYAVHIEEMAIERRSTPGIVNARLTLVRAQ